MAPSRVVLSVTANISTGRLVALAALFLGCSGKVASEEPVWGNPNAGASSAGTPGVPPGGNGAGGASANGGSGNGPTGGNTPGAGSSAGGASAVGGAGPTTGGIPGVPGIAPGEFMRLTRAEYRSTVEGALGVEPDVTTIPEDGRVGHFTSNVEVTPDPVHPYLLAGEEIASAVVPARLPACEAASAENCVGEDYRAALEGLYRRPLSAAEVSAFAQIVSSVVAEGGTTTDGTRAMLASALMSPDFLFRAAPSNGGPNPSARRMAERLSYALWDAPPDDDLAAVAQGSGDLVQALQAAGARLSRDQRANGVLARFLGQWLDVDIDLRLEGDGFEDSPDYLELLALVRDAMENDTPVTDLIGGQRGFVHRDNADAYGLDEDELEGQDDVAAVGWGADSPRRGILSEELLAGSTRHPDHSRRQIFRGLLVRRQLLCDTIAAPDPELIALAGEVTDRTTDVRCAGCHLMLDPIGRTFASLDQDDEGGEVPSAEVTSHTELQGTYAGLAELLEAVAGSRAFAECFSRNWLGFFLEQPVASVDPTWIAVLADAVESGASLGAVVELTVGELEARSDPVPWCTGE